MINFILTTICVLSLAITKSKYSIIVFVYFACLVFCNIFFIKNNELFSNIFSIAIPSVCLICSIWNMNKEIYRQKLFYISFTLFALCSIKAFCATDALSMFVYMETSMIPMVLMMCSEDKHTNIKAVYQYLTYTFVSACLLLIAIIQIKIDTKEYSFVPTTTWCYWLITLSATIKLPMFPFHYWLPIVHGKSATTCSILFAGVILKYSSLIIIRFLMPLPPYAMYLIFASVVSAACSQYREKDIKVIFAYSSIIHINLYLFILLSDACQTNFAFSLLAHSVTMVLAFFATDIIKARYKTLYIKNLTNISNKIWKLLLIASLCVTAIPGSIGFIAELQALYNANRCNLIITGIIMALILLSSCYTMHMCFTVKSNISKYDLFKFGNLQKAAIIITSSLIAIGGILPLFM